MWNLKPPLSKSVRLGCGPAKPPFTLPPARKMGAAPPCPVPRVIPLQIVDKGGHRLGQLVQHGAVIAELIGMVIETADSPPAKFGEEDANPDIGTNELGDGAKISGQPERWIVGGLRG